MLAVALISCTIAFYLYFKKLKRIIYEKDRKINELEMAVGYAETGLDMCNKKINVLTGQVTKLNSDNKLLAAKLSKLNNQFKNAKDYLNKN